MRHRIYEVDADGLLHDGLDESEDVMDLDDSHVMNFLDVNHEVLPSAEHLGVGFYEELEAMLPEDEEIEEILAALDVMDSELSEEQA